MDRDRRVICPVFMLVCVWQLSIFGVFTFTTFITRILEPLSDIIQMCRQFDMSVTCLNTVKRSHNDNLAWLDRVRFLLNIHHCTDFNAVGVTLKHQQHQVKYRERDWMHVLFCLLKSTAAWIYHLSSINQETLKWGNLKNSSC